jgi:hypothetical protein
MIRNRILKSLGIVAALAATSLSTELAAQEQPVPDTYTVMTTNMTPADVELKADILDWSDEAQRTAAVEALAADDPAAALRELPTLGIVWRSGSVVGHSVKYAHRTELADGGEQITLVTDRRIGSTSFTPWAANDAPDSEPLDYSVVEFRTGAGEGGTLSLGAEILVDAGNGLISLDPGSRAPLLTSITKQPEPYWAESD